MTGSAAASTEEYIELVSAEQYVDLPKLRDYARHGIQPAVRGEVWLYLLGVLADDKSQEMTSVRSKYKEYDQLDKQSDKYEKRIQADAAKYYQRRLIPRPPPGRKSGQPAQRLALRGARLPSARSIDDLKLGEAAPKREGKENESTEAGHRETVNHAEYDKAGNGTDAGEGLVTQASLEANAPADQQGRHVAPATHAESSEDGARRFCSAVEDIVCAHLNRHKLRAGASSEDKNRGAPASLSEPSEASTAIRSDDAEPHDQGSKPSATLQDAARGQTPINVFETPHSSQYHPDLVVLCAPFVTCIRSEAGMFFAFERLMTMVEQYNQRHPLSTRIATFLTLFRTTLPELYAYFDEEEVDVIGLASAWLRHLLAAEMRIEDLMRLWDTYFAVPDPLDLHMYVCLAILTNCKDALEELDQSEVKSMLTSLPPLDVDRIINEAMNIRLAHRQSEMLGASDGEGDSDDDNNEERSAETQDAGDMTMQNESKD